MLASINVGLPPVPVIPLVEPPPTVTITNPAPTPMGVGQNSPVPPPPSPLPGMTAVRPLSPATQGHQHQHQQQQQQQQQQPSPQMPQSLSPQIPHQPQQGQSQPQLQAAHQGPMMHQPGGVNQTQPQVQQPQGPQTGQQYYTNPGAAAGLYTLPGAARGTPLRPGAPVRCCKVSVARLFARTHATALQGQPGLLPQARPFTGPSSVAPMGQTTVQQQGQQQGQQQQPMQTQPSIQGATVAPGMPLGYLRPQTPMRTPFPTAQPGLVQTGLPVNASAATAQLGVPQAQPQAGQPQAQPSQAAGPPRVFTSTIRTVRCRPARTDATSKVQCLITHSI